MKHSDVSFLPRFIRKGRGRVVLTELGISCMAPGTEHIPGHTHADGKPPLPVSFF